MSEDLRRRMLKFVRAIFIIGLAALPNIAQAASIVIVAFGDSQTYGSGRTAAGRSGGAPVSEAYPAKLERALRAKGWDVVVLNEGSPGRSAAEGVLAVDRLPPANLTIVQLGSIDRARGAQVATIGANLATIVDKLRARGSVVMLGQNWIPEEESLFAAAHKSANVTTRGLFEDLYRGGGAQHRGGEIRPEFDGGDGTHSNAAGYDLIVSEMLPIVEQTLTQTGFKPGQNPR